MNLLDEIKELKEKLIKDILYGDDLFHEKEMSPSELEGVLNGRKI